MFLLASLVRLTCCESVIHHEKAAGLAVKLQVTETLLKFKQQVKGAEKVCPLAAVVHAEQRGACRTRAGEGALHLLFLEFRRADEESLLSGERLVGSSDPPRLLLFYPLTLLCSELAKKKKKIKFFHGSKVVQLLLKSHGINFERTKEAQIFVRCF